MYARIKSMVVMMALGGAALMLSGCCGSENKAASAKCRNSAPNATSCQTCCKSVTSKDAYSYASGSGCKCY